MGGGKSRLRFLAVLLCLSSAQRLLKRRPNFAFNPSFEDIGSAFGIA
jgi:hypothetical protein